MDTEQKLTAMIQWYSDRLADATLALGQSEIALKATKIELADAQQKLQAANAGPGASES